MSFRMVPLSTTTGGLSRASVPPPTTTRWRAGSAMREWWDYYVSLSPPQTDNVVDASGGHALSQSTKWEFVGPPEDWLEGGSAPWDTDGSAKEHIDTYYLGGDIQLATEIGPFGQGKLVKSSVKVNGVTQKDSSTLATGDRQEIDFGNIGSVPLTTEGSPPLVEIESVEDGFVPVAYIGQYDNGVPNYKDLHYSYEITNYTPALWTGRFGDFVNCTSKAYATADQLIFAPGKPEPTNLSVSRSAVRGGIGSGTVSSGVKAVGTFRGVLKVEMISGLASLDLAIRDDHGSQGLRIYVSIDGGPLQFWTGSQRYERASGVQYRVSNGSLVQVNSPKRYNRVYLLSKQGDAVTNYYIVSGAPETSPTTFTDPQTPSQVPSWGYFVEEGQDYYEVPWRGLKWRTTGWGTRTYSAANGLVTAEIRPRVL